MSAHKRACSGARQAAPVDGARFGQGVRALRRRRGWTQAQLAAAAGMSQAAVSRAECGRAGCLTGDLLDRLVAPLGARVETRLLWHGEGLDRLVDARHAAIVEVVVLRLTRLGWDSGVEVTFSVYGERGSIDVLAFHPQTRSLLVIEAKSVVPDLQAMLAAVDRKVRLASGVGRDRGWHATSVSTILVIPDTTTNRDRVRRHAATLAARLPVRTAALQRWLATPSGIVAGILFVPSPTTRRASARAR